MDDNNLSRFQRFMRSAYDHREKAEWELAENALNDSETLCKKRGFPGAEQHKLEIYFELAEVKRRHGKYEEAADAHIRAMSSSAIDKVKMINVKGELGVVYRHMGRIAEAQKTLEEHYTLASNLSLEMEAEVCRSAGNLGMTNYQLYEEQADKSDKTLLHRAIPLLEERISRAQSIQTKLANNDDYAPLRRRLRMWESIAISRLSLAYLAAGELEKALEYGAQTVEHTKSSPDPTIRAISRYIYGNALQRCGRLADAKIEYNFPSQIGKTTPAIALCKEPSEEHRRYLRQMIDVGVDLDAYDEQGYSALDYTVYCNDTDGTDAVLDGLAKVLPYQELMRRKPLALLRKHFWDIFHSQFRPILLQGRSRCVQELRNKYVQLLNSEEEKRDRFDKLRLISYSDFCEHGQLPRFDLKASNTHAFTDIVNSHGDPYIVFISYRWIGRESKPSLSGPDDQGNTQYRRMLEALKDLLETQDELDSRDLHIWLDCACIDQDNIEAGRRERGINALPIYLAQCNAMISLVDDSYFDRAWCAVEVLIMQTLRESYSARTFHWFEHTLHQPTVDRIHGALQEGRPKPVQPSRMALSHETDRRHISFLERQSMLLGRSALDA